MLASDLQEGEVGRLRQGDVFMYVGYLASFVDVVVNGESYEG